MKATMPEKLWLRQVLSYNSVIVQPCENEEWNCCMISNEMDGRRGLPAVLLYSSTFSSSVLSLFHIGEKSGLHILRQERQIRGWFRIFQTISGPVSLITGFAFQLLQQTDIFLFYLCQFFIRKTLRPPFSPIPWLFLHIFCENWVLKLSPMGGVNSVSHKLQFFCLTGAKLCTAQISFKSSPLLLHRVILSQNGLCFFGKLFLVLSLRNGNHTVSVLFLRQDHGSLTDSCVLAVSSPGDSSMDSAVTCEAIFSPDNSSSAAFSISSMLF